MWHFVIFTLAVNFNINAVGTHIAEKNWVGLEMYLEKFLKDVQGVDFHEHPGIMCSLYKSMIGDFIMNENFDDSSTLFNEKVKRLNQINGIYHPHDLEADIKHLEYCTENCTLPVEKHDLMTVIYDYVHLYFPESLGIKGKDSAVDFLRETKDDSGKTKLLCLACRWDVPNFSKFKSHINHSDDKVKRCANVTEKLRVDLAAILCANACEQTGSFGTPPGRTGRKRKVMDGFQKNSKSSGRDKSKSAGRSSDCHDKSAVGKSGKSAEDMYQEIIQINISSYGIVKNHVTSNAVTVDILQRLSKQLKLLVELQDSILTQDLSCLEATVLEELQQVQNLLEKILWLAKQLPPAASARLNAPLMRQFALLNEMKFLLLSF